MNQSNVLLYAVRLSCKAKSLMDLCFLSAIRFISRKRPPLTKSEKILVIRLDHKLGDMAMFIEFLLKLSQAYSKECIDLVIHESQIKLFDGCDIAKNIYPYSWGSSLKKSFFGRVFAAYAFYKCNLSKNHYSMVLIPRVDYDLHAALIGYLAKDKVMIGWSEQSSEYKTLVNYKFDTFYSQVLIAELGSHELTNADMLLNTIYDRAKTDAIYRYWYLPGDFEAVNNFLLHSVHSQRFVCIAPGAFDKKRQWPIDNFKSLSFALYRDYGIISLYLGSKNEHELCESAVHPLNGIALNLAGKFSLGFLYCLLKNSSLFIGNDSGLMHFASLANAKIIEISCHPITGSLSHQNSPTRFGPWSERFVVCQPATATRPCIDCCVSNVSHCINYVSVQQVIEQSVSLLQ